MNELWKQAQKLAEENYEKEYGACTWDDADKYEREDWVFAEYEKLGGFELEKETKNMCRDPKTGRFVSTKTTEYGNNETTKKINLEKINLKKENDTMKTNKEMRMEALRNNGVNVDNFFDLSLRVPFDAEVVIKVDGKETVIKVDGKEMVVPATNGKATGVGNGLVGTYVGVPTIVSSNGDICNAETGEVLVMANPNSITVNGIVDPIAQGIINDGYVKNSKLYRRWIFAKTISMLEYVDRKNPMRTGWEACMKDRFAYGYVFDMIADELHTLAKLQKEDPEYFEERTKFFNGDVVVATLNDYLYRLKKYCKKQMRENPRAYRGEAYCKLVRYGNVLVKDLDTKVYARIQNGIEDIKAAAIRDDYYLMEMLFKNFMKELYNKLPYETPKCATWKDAYKGAGSFYSLQNAIRWHNVVLKGCANKYESEAKLYNLLYGEYKNEVWRFHNLLVETIEYNKFNLKQSIANGHKADGTTSTRALRYKR